MKNYSILSEGTGWLMIFITYLFIRIYHSRRAPDLALQPREKIGAEWRAQNHSEDESGKAGEACRTPVQAKEARRPNLNRLRRNGLARFPAISLVDENQERPGCTPIRTRPRRFHPPAKIRGFPGNQRLADWLRGMNFNNRHAQ
jgi:hypothetical protein